MRTVLFSAVCLLAACADPSQTPPVKVSFSPCETTVTLPAAPPTPRTSAQLAKYAQTAAAVATAAIHERDLCAAQYLNLMKLLTSQR